MNADHTHSLDSAITAAKAGFDSIVYDLSASPFDQNIRRTKQAVETLKSINPAIPMEVGIGDIGTGLRFMNRGLIARRILPLQRKQISM
jgi:fructose-bisphosphate aldolase class II